MLHKRVTTENNSNSQTKFGTQKARIQRPRNPNLRRSLRVKTWWVLALSYVTCEKKQIRTQKPAYLQWNNSSRTRQSSPLRNYANLQAGKNYFSIASKEDVQQYLGYCKRDQELGHIVRGHFDQLAKWDWVNILSDEITLK